MLNESITLSVNSALSLRDQIDSIASQLSYWVAEWNSTTRLTNMEESVYVHFSRTWFLGDKRYCQYKVTSSDKKRNYGKG